jgi:mannose/cellobiose epimerase-like protein (N-acyl-D-glucosamine 2-epimerase family)
MVPADLGAWLTRTLVPAWIARTVVAGSPGYVESFTHAGEPDPAPARTTLVTARLVYVYSHAYLLRPDPAALAAAQHGVAFLLTRCRGSDGRFRHRVQPDGTAIDDRTDLYDLAFVLFALAWFARASGDRQVLTAADEIDAFMEAELARPNGGFAEDSLGTLPRRQNPHMHLLEAFHALAETTGEARWLDRARAIVRLTEASLFDRETGSLGEFFPGDWQPWPGERGRLREPGHHFEWVWLLAHHARLTGERHGLGLADRLHAFGLRHGIAALPDGSPLVLDEIDRNGTPVATTGLLWPQTEAIKAFSARLEAGDASAGARLDAHLATIFRHFVDADTGLWHNQVTAEGEPVRAAIPVRVLYHLVLALAEVTRVRGLP